VDAGGPITICAGDPVPLTGTIGGSATSATWSSSGTGTFDNPSSLNAVYTPSDDDIANGSVTLTLTTNDPAGACPAVSDDVVITINAAPTVDAGEIVRASCREAGPLTGATGGSGTSATCGRSGSADGYYWRQRNKRDMVVIRHRYI